MALPLLAIGAGLGIGGTLSKLFGKDIDFPFFNADIQIKDGVAIPAGNVNVLDTGSRTDAVKLRDATIAQINSTLEQLGVAGQKGLTNAAFQVGVVAGGRKGSLPGGFFSGIQDGKEQSFGSGIQNKGAKNVDEGITKAVEFAVQQIYDTAGTEFKSNVDAVGGAEGVARANSTASGLSIEVPEKFEDNNFWQKLGTGLQIAGAVVGAAGAAQNLGLLGAEGAATAGGSTLSGAGGIAGAPLAGAGSGTAALAGAGASSIPAGAVAGGTFTAAQLGAGIGSAAAAGGGQATAAALAAGLQPGALSSGGLASLPSVGGAGTGTGAGSGFGGLGRVADIIGSAAPLVSSLLTQGQGADAATAAALAQQRGQQLGIDELRRQFDVTQGNLQPFIGAGQRSLGDLERAATVGGLNERLGQIFSMDEFGNLVDERQRGVQGQLSAGGLTRSGTALQEAARVPTELGFGIENQLFSRQSDLANVGLSAATGLGQFGANQAGNVANLLNQQGQAQASGIITGQQADAAGTQNILNSAASLFNTIFG